jgi:predicted kinase
MRFIDLEEGVNDPAIFKVVFLGGGPGSGKSYAAKQLGLSALGLKSVNSDEALEYLMSKRNLSFDMPDDEAEQRNAVRDRAKDLTDIKQHSFLKGRLGLVIDGTAKDPNKIAGLRKKFEEFGYDTAMILVNTSLKVAMQRNLQRARSVPQKLLIDSHKQVQKARPELESLFGSDFHEINSDTASNFNRDIQAVSKKINQFVNKPLSKKATDWVNTQMLAASGSLGEMASYDGNIGVMELVKFFQVAPEDVAKKVKQLIDDKKNKQAWEIIQRVTGVKLKGDEFEFAESDFADALSLVNETDDLKFPHDSDVDIPRNEMPQIGMKDLQNDYRLVKGQLRISKIKPSQSQRVPGMVQSVIDDLLSGKMKNKPLVVDKNGYLVNGHHRLDALKHIAKDYDNGDMKVSVIMVDAKLEDLIDDFSHTTSAAFAEEEHVEENFADGKVKGKSRPGRFKKAGVSCKGSVTSLRKKAKNSSGEKQKGYHWCANMKSGKKK